MAADAWMRGNRGLKGALLALLSEEPGHGYDVATRLARRLGPALRVEPKSVYARLAQLEREGLLRAAVGEGGARRLEGRTVYYPTALAEEAISDWMACPIPQLPPADELLLKFVVARSQDVPALLEMLDIRELECLDSLRENAEFEVASVASWTSRVIRVLRASADRHLQAELDWIEGARRELREFLQEQRRLR